MKKSRLHLALHHVFNPQGQQLATGAIVDAGGVPVAMVHSWVSVKHAGPKRGRKRNFARAAAVVFAHYWYCDHDKLGRGRADSAVAELLGYSEARAVRRIRSQTGPKVKEGMGFAFTVDTRRSTGRIEDSTVMLWGVKTKIHVEGGDFQFEGPGWVWPFGEREAQYQDCWVAKGNIAQPSAEGLEVLSQFRVGGGHKL